MTDELAIYQNPPDTLHRLVTDDWFEAFGNIIKLAEYVADTEFVPDTMRRRPAAVAAAILTGREMGLAPMVALRMLYIVHGRVGQTAELMRALILRAGHELRDIEVTPTRVILEGRRRGETEWARAAFTDADARKGGIRLGDYPTDKLYARATSRLARRKFADVIAGLPSVDELEDLPDGVTDYAGADGPAGPPVTSSVPAGPPVSRKRATKAPKATRTQPKAAPKPEAPPDIEIAELLDDTPEPPQSPADQNRNQPPRQRQGHDPTAHSQESLDLSGPATEDTTTDTEPEPQPEPPRITKPQLTKLHILLQAAGLGDRDTGLAWLTALTGRDITSSKDLYRDEATRAIDTLENEDSHQ